MRIALVSNEYPPGIKRGIGVFTRLLASGLVWHAGHDVLVFTCRQASGRSATGLQAVEDEVEGVSVVRLDFDPPSWMRWRPGVYWSRWRFKRLLAEHHRSRPFDVVECMDAAGWLPWGGLPGVPTVVRCHGAMYFFDEALGLTTGDPMVSRLERSTIARADHVVGVSKFILDGQLKLLRRRWRGRSSVIHNAVDTGFFRPMPGAGVRPSPRSVVFTGALHERKGVFVLADAAAAVLRRHPDVVFRLHGPDYHQPTGGQTTAQRILERVPAEFRDRFQILPPVERTENGLLRVLQEAAVCCFPSRMEPFGLTVVEAMACGRPVVFSNEGSGPELIEDGVSGLLCDSRDPGDVADKLNRLLDEPAVAETIGIGARRRVEQCFSQKHLVEASAELYEGLARGRE